MIAATRQDVQSAFERARSSIMGNMVSRNDVQLSVTQLRNSILQDIHDLHAENQQAIRQSQAQRYQSMVKITNIEHQVAGMNQILLRILDQQSRLLNMIQR